MPYLISILSFFVTCMSAGIITFGPMLMATSKAVGEETIGKSWPDYYMYAGFVLGPALFVTCFFGIWRYLKNGAMDNPALLMMFGSVPVATIVILIAMKVMPS